MRGKKSKQPPPPPAPSFRPSDFDVTTPTTFYLLGPGRADMEALADATLVVEGRRLPAHSQMLSQHSGVLRGLFADLRGGSGGEARVGCKRKSENEEGLVLEAPFEGSTLFDACLFLRLCYRPEDCTPANLAAVRGSLPCLLRLAHKLDAPPIQQAVGDYMAGEAHSASLPRVLDWVAAADHCQLPELRMRCLSGVARRLASGPGGLAGSLADAAVAAECCDKSTLAQVLGLVVAAGQAACPKKFANSLPAPGAAVAALQQAANPGSFEWALERYSQRPSGIGQKVESPSFSAAGREWHFLIYPGGKRAELAGHLSVYLMCKQPGTRAKYKLTLVDQAAEAPEHIIDVIGDIGLFTANTAWGVRKFASHERLRSRPGYLAGDRLVLRATVEVVL